MAPQRGIDEGTAGGQLAVFLVELTRQTPVRELSDRFGRSSSTWGNYLNGSTLIPRQLVGRLVESFTPPGSTRNTKAVRGLELWKAAEAERRAGRSPSAGGELVRGRQRRDDALQQVVKYRAVAANAENHLAELRPMLAHTQSRLEHAERQLRLGDERERARAERRLGQARERLGRVRVQQELARRRRMTAEEQQEFWMAEVLSAQEEISRLEREVRDLVTVPPGPLEPVRRDAADTPDAPDAVDDADFEARLEHITAEGLEDAALIEEDLQHLRPPPADPVQPLSSPALDKPALDKPATSGDRRLGQTLAWRRLVLPLPLLGVTGFLYWACQEAAFSRIGGWAVIPATVLCLPVLYGSLRATTVRKLPARIAAPLLHIAWSALLVLDQLPWPPPGTGAR
ncbi:hypothetical protein AB0F20_08690 [Streptomyces goshikiensis]|uniref:hypothetical protein n=1 Tax=Streptomyces goshikiensis TaxID=1942 RepID=UPI0033E21242